MEEKKNVALGIIIWAVIIFAVVMVFRAGSSSEPEAPAVEEKMEVVEAPTDQAIQDEIDELVIHVQAATYAIEQSVECDEETILLFVDWVEEVNSKVNRFTELVETGTEAQSQTIERNFPEFEPMVRRLLQAAADHGEFCF